MKRVEIDGVEVCILADVGPDGSLVGLRFKFFLECIAPGVFVRMHLGGIGRRLYRAIVLLLLFAALIDCCNDKPNSLVHLALRASTIC